MPNEQLMNGEKSTLPLSPRKRPWGARIRRWCYRWCDQLKLAEFWCFVVGGMLIAIGCTYFFAKGEFAEQLVRLKDQSDKQINQLTGINNDLQKTIETKLGPMASQMDEVKDQLPELSDKVDSVEKTANVAAARSTKAAKSARQALKKPTPIYIPHGTPDIRPKESPACIAGKDAYNDPC